MGVFRFKQFSVNDDRCSMKVGTDAVLLGAWCTVGGAKRILDIGTGSGVIALMMAQRSLITTHIDAVELLPHDAVEAKANVQASPWPEKISVIQSSIQDYRPPDAYDLIVCNPPYFSKSLLPPQEDRTTVRHTETLPHHELIEAAVRLLAPSGQFSVILPTAQGAVFLRESTERRLCLRKITRFFSRAGKPQKRSLMTFQLAKNASHEDSLFLYGPDRNRSEAYVRLTQDFYLDGKTV